MIKIRCKKNLLYLFIYYISSIINYIILSIIFYWYFQYYPISACIYIYPFENIIGGLIVFLYQRNSIKKKEKIKYFGLNLINFIIWKFFLLKYKGY